MLSGVSGMLRDRLCVRYMLLVRLFMRKAATVYALLRDCLCVKLRPFMRERTEVMHRVINSTGPLPGSSFFVKGLHGCVRAG